MPGSWKFRWWIERETSKLTLFCEKWLAFRDVCRHMLSLYSWKKRKFKGVKGVFGFVLPFVCWALCCHDFGGAMWLVLVVCIGFFIFKTLNYCPGWGPQTLDLQTDPKGFVCLWVSQCPFQLSQGDAQFQMFKCCYFLWGDLWLLQKIRAIPSFSVVLQHTKLFFLQGFSAFGS